MKAADTMLERVRPITDEAVMALSNLTSLNLNNNFSITQRTLDHFATQLECLSLFDNRLIDDVFEWSTELIPLKETERYMYGEYDSDEEGDRLVVAREMTGINSKYPNLQKVQWNIGEAYYLHTRK